MHYLIKYFAYPKFIFCGYWLHFICSICFFQSVDLLPASVHDIDYLQDIKLQLSNCVWLENKSCLSQSTQIDLFNEVDIQLEIPKRVNQKDYKSQFYPFKKKYKKRFETLFSQFCDQFMIRRNYIKTFEILKL